MFGIFNRKRPSGVGFGFGVGGGGGGWNQRGVRGVNAGDGFAVDAEAEALAESITARFSSFRKSVHIAATEGFEGDDRDDRSAKLVVRVDTTMINSQSEQRVAEDVGRELGELLELLCEAEGNTERQRAMLPALLPVLPLLVVFLPKFDREGMVHAAAVFCKLIYLADHPAASAPGSGVWPSSAEAGAAGSSRNMVIEYILENAMLMHVLVALVTINVENRDAAGPMSRTRSIASSSPNVHRSSLDYAAGSPDTGGIGASAAATGDPARAKTFTYISAKGNLADSILSPTTATELELPSILGELRAHATSMLKCCLGLSGELAVTLLASDELVAQMIDAIAGTDVTTHYVDGQRLEDERRGTGSPSSTPRLQHERRANAPTNTSWRAPKADLPHAREEDEVSDTIFDLLRDALLSHRTVVSEYFLQESSASAASGGGDVFHRFVQTYARLLTSGTERTRVKSLKLLAKLLCSKFEAGPAEEERSDRDGADVHLLIRFLEDTSNVELICQLMDPIPAYNVHGASEGKCLETSMQTELFRMMLPTIIASPAAMTTIFGHEVCTRAGQAAEVCDFGGRLERTLRHLSTTALAFDEGAESTLSVILAFVETLARHAFVPAAVIEFIESLLRARLSSSTSSGAMSSTEGRVRSRVASETGSSAKGGSADTLLLPNFSMHHPAKDNRDKKKKKKMARDRIPVATKRAPECTLTNAELIERVLSIVATLVEMAPASRECTTTTAKVHRIVAADDLGRTRTLVLRASGLMSVLRLLGELETHVETDGGAGDRIESLTLEVMGSETRVKCVGADEADEGAEGLMDSDLRGDDVIVSGADFGLQMLRTSRLPTCADEEHPAATSFEATRAASITCIEEYVERIATKLHLKVVLECGIKLLPRSGELSGADGDDGARSSSGVVYPDQVFGIEIRASPGSQHPDAQTATADSASVASATVPLLTRRADGEPYEHFFKLSLPYTGSVYRNESGARTLREGFDHVSSSFASCWALLSSSDGETEYVVTLPAIRIHIEDRMVPLPPHIVQLIAGRVAESVDDSRRDRERSSLFDHLWRRCDAVGVSARKMVKVRNATKLIARLRRARGEHESVAPSSDRSAARLKELLVDEVADTADEIRLCAWIPPHYHLLIVLVIVRRTPPEPAYVIVRACSDCVDFFVNGEFDTFMEAAIASLDS